MLSAVGLEFQGQPHCGLDDAKNISRVLIRLISDNAFVRINERIILKEKNDNKPSSETQQPYHSRLGTVAPAIRRDAEAWHKRQVAALKKHKKEE